MSEGAANEARVVISTDYQTMKDFVEFTQKGLDDIKNRGKGGFGELGKTVSDFAGTTLKGAFLGAGMQLVDAVISPLRKGFSELISDAEKFRGVVTRTALAAGEELTKIEIELDKLSRKTGVDVEQLASFVEGVRGQTGNRKAAVAAIEGARKESLARGYGSVTEMTGEVGQLQRRWGVDDVESFFNQERSRAKALGLNENVAAETSKRMRGTYEDAGMSAEQVGRWSNTLLQASKGDMQLALKAGQEFFAQAQGAEGRGALERTLGLKQGALVDKDGGTDIARAIELMQKFQRGHRGQQGLEFVARQHFSPRVAKLFSQDMPGIAASYDAQLYADAGTPLQDVDRQWRESEEGQAQLNDQRIKSEDRESGKGWASYKQRVRKELGGGMSGWLGVLNPDVWPVLAGGKERASDLLSREMHENDVRTQERDRRFKQEYEAHQARVRSGQEQTSSFWNPTGGASPIPLGGPGFSPALPAVPGWGGAQDPKQLAVEQGKALGDTLQKGNALPVTIRGSVTVQTGPAPSTGYGGQHG